MISTNRIVAALLFAASIAASPDTAAASESVSDSFVLDTRFVSPATEAASVSFSLDTRGMMLDVSEAISTAFVVDNRNVFQTYPAPTGLIATDGVYTDKVLLAWNLIAGVTGYQVWRSPSNTTASAELVGSPTLAYFEDFSAGPGVTYYYWVKAVYPGGTSDFSLGDSGYRGLASPSLSVTPAIRDVSSAGGNAAFDVSNIGGGTMNWTASVQGASWANISSGASGTNAGVITVSYSGNPSTTQRTASIVVSAPGATPPEVTVTLRQAGSATPVLQVTPTNATVPYTAGSTSFTVSNTGGGSLSWQAEVIQGAWLQITSGATGTNAGTISVSREQNPLPSTAPRLGRIRVTAVGAQNSPTDIEITQLAAAPPATNPRLEVWSTATNQFSHFEGSLPTDRNVFVIVHGWNPSILPKSEELPDWMREVAHAIKQGLGVDSLVLAWNWLDESDGPLPPTSKVEGHGAALAAALISRSLDQAPSITFIGHSLGAAVVSHAAKSVQMQGKQTPLNLFLLDPPETGLAQLPPENFGSGPVRLSTTLQYLASSVGKPAALIQNIKSEFGTTYNSAENIWLADAADIYPTPASTTGTFPDIYYDHVFAHAWFEATIFPDTDEFPGVITAGEPGNNSEGRWLRNYFTYYDEDDASEIADFWNGVNNTGFGVLDNFANLRNVVLYPDGTKEWGPFDIFGGYRPFNMGLTQTKIDIQTDPDYVDVYTDTIDNADLWIGSSGGSVTDGALLLDGDGSSIYTDVAIPDSADVLRFDYMPVSVVDNTTLRLFINDVQGIELKLFSNMDGQNVTSGWVDVTDWAGMTVRLLFQLNADPAASTVVVDNLAFSDEIYPSSDQDADGILDTDEGFGDPDADTVPNLMDTDSDGDGLTDVEEGTGDDDADGIPNYLDRGTDEDNDDLLDIDESIIGTSPTNPDSDADGLPDGWEVRFSFDPVATDDSAEDPDGDDLLNSEEYELGTLPNRWDTDGDGTSDGQEVLLGTNPLDPLNYPQQTLFGDINSDGSVDAVDVQLVINAALGLNGDPDADLDVNGAVDAVDVQLMVNAALGF